MQIRRPMCSDSFNPKSGRWLLAALILSAAFLSFMGVSLYPASAQSPPVISAVAPAVVENDAARELTITGSGFEAAPTVTLGTAALPGVGFVDTGTLTATIPAGFAAGVYDLTVTNPDGLGDTLPRGVNVQNPPPSTSRRRLGSGPRAAPTAPRLSILP
jgi:hypothetical protein